MCVACHASGFGFHFNFLYFVLQTGKKICYIIVITLCNSEVNSRHLVTDYCSIRCIECICEIFVGKRKITPVFYFVCWQTVPVLFVVCQASVQQTVMLIKSVGLFTQ